MCCRPDSADCSFSGFCTAPTGWPAGLTASDLYVMDYILTLNSGSSSLKFSLYEADLEQPPVLHGNFSDLETGCARFLASSADQGQVVEKSVPCRDHAAAMQHLCDWLEDMIAFGDVRGVGHRIVHGGSHYVRHMPVDGAMVSTLESLIPLAPSHLPPALSTIGEARTLFGSAVHVACFDTAFHRTMPEVARVLPVPFSLFEEGVERYGFHGLSYEYICSVLEKDEQAADCATIVAHLGHGCSLAAIRSFRSVDTTMAFSPCAGLTMSTRSGDIDPGLVAYLCEQKGYSPERFEHCMTHESGLLGISGITADMKTLLASSDRRAQLAVSVFCHSARKHIASMAASLAGLDRLVFTGGIGENSSEIRARICDGLAFLGIEIDVESNADNQTLINSGATRVLVIPTNEELMIARHTRSFMS